MPDPPTIDALDAALTTWLRRGYEFGSGRRYIEALDLTAGGSLVAACERACPWYGETVQNEREYLRHMMQRFAVMNGGKFQVVLFGPDMSPFCLELLETIPNLRAVFEVGGPLMGLKRDLIFEASPRSIARLRFQEADLEDGDLREMLMEEGDNDLAGEMATVVVFESASRYSLNQLSSALKVFRPTGRNLVVMHHMVPSAEAGDDAGTAAALRDAFGEACAGWQPHSESSISGLLTAAKARMIAHAGLNALEQLNPARPVRFGSGEGWGMTSYAIL